MIIHWREYNALMVDDQETEGRRQRRWWQGAQGAPSSPLGPFGVNGLGTPKILPTHVNWFLLVPTRLGNQ